MLLPLLCYADSIPGGGSSGFQGIAENIKDTFSSFAKLITAGSFLAGLGLAFLAILKFKEYRDASPGQGKLGLPITYLFVAVAFLFLPHLTKEAGNTIFGGNTPAGSISGETSLDNLS